MALAPETLERLRIRLLERRRVLVRSTRRGQRELDDMATNEPRPEMEENAQSATAEYVITQLNDAQRREVAAIDAALSRMDAGTYGECITCGEDISEARLEAMPYALRDAECAAREEARELGDRSLPTL